MLYQRAVIVLGKSMGSEHPMVANILNGHAEALRKLHRKKEAAALEQRARSILATQGMRRGSLTVDVGDLAPHESLLQPAPSCQLPVAVRPWGAEGPTAPTASTRLPE
jgi:hypothetical protein